MGYSLLCDVRHAGIDGDGALLIPVEERQLGADLRTVVRTGAGEDLAAQWREPPSGEPGRVDDEHLVLVRRGVAIEVAVEEEVDHPEVGIVGANRQHLLLLVRHDEWRHLRGVQGDRPLELRSDIDLVGLDGRAGPDQLEEVVEDGLRERDVAQGGVVRADDVHQPAHRRCCVGRARRGAALYQGQLHVALEAHNLLRLLVHEGVVKPRVQRGAVPVGDREALVEDLGVVGRARRKGAVDGRVVDALELRIGRGIPVRVGLPLYVVVCDGYLLETGQDRGLVGGDVVARLLMQPWTVSSADEALTQRPVRTFSSQQGAHKWRSQPGPIPSASP